MEQELHRQPALGAVEDAPDLPVVRHTHAGRGHDPSPEDGDQTTAVQVVNISQAAPREAAAKDSRDSVVTKGLRALAHQAGHRAGRNRSVATQDQLPRTESVKPSSIVNIGMALADLTSTKPGQGRSPRIIQRIWAVGPCIMNNATAPVKSAHDGEKPERCSASARFQTRRLGAQGSNGALALF